MLHGGLTLVFHDWSLDLGRCGGGIDEASGGRSDGGRLVVIEPERTGRLWIGTPGDMRGEGAGDSTSERAWEEWPDLNIADIVDKRADGA